MLSVQICLLFTFAAVAAGAPSRADVADLRRAHIPRPPPGSPVLGQTATHALAGMVKALRSSGAPTRPCEQWGLKELNSVASRLLRERDPVFDELYKKKNDRRSLHFDPQSNHKELLWAAEDELEVASRGHDIARDGKCAELVMWWVHHLSHQSRSKLSAQKGFLLPEPPAKIEDTSVAKEHGAKEYVYQITCAACHVNIGPHGVIPPPAPAPPSGPKWDVCDKDPKHPGLVWYEGEKAPIGTRKKRCDWDYNPAPVMCEAIGGIIWGDGKDEFQATECEPFMNASDIPKGNLTSPIWPISFTVKEHAVGINQCDKVDDPFGCKFPGSKPCAPHKFLNETYYAEYYDGSATGPRVTVHRNDGNIIQPKDGNMYVQTMPNHPRFDFCLCVGTAQDGLAPPAPVLGALRHDFAKDAILIGRERIRLEYLNRWAIADHWMKGPHNFWVEVSTNQMVRGWQAYNGLQIWYDWDNTMPSEDKFVVPEGCYKGFLHKNVSCRAPPPPSPAPKGAFLKGFVEGFLSDKPDLKTCLLDSGTALGDMKEAFQDFKGKEWVKGLQKLVDGLDHLSAALVDCKAPIADLRGIIGVLKKIKGFRNFALHTGADVITYFKDIVEELEAGSNGCKDEQYEYCGKEFGMALRRIIAGQASDHEPLCRMGEPEATCKITGEGCDGKPVTFDPVNLTVWKWDKATKKYGSKPYGQLEAHVAAGSADDWQMYLHGPMFRPWREMEEGASSPPFYVQATMTNKVFRFEHLKKEGGKGRRGLPLHGVQKVVANAIAPSTSFPIENSTGGLQGMLVAEGQPFLVNALLDPKHTELDWGGVDYISDKCQRIFPNAVDKVSHYKTGGDVVNTVSCHPYTGICFFSVWKFYDDQPPFWNNITAKLMPDCLHYCVSHGSLVDIGKGCLKGGVVKDEHGVPICSKPGEGAVHGFTVAFGANLTHKDPNEFDIFLVMTGGAQFVGGESSLHKVLCKKDANGDLVVMKSQLFGRDLFEATVNRTSPYGPAKVDVGGDHVWADESGKYLWASTFRTANAGVHMLDYETGDLIYSVHGTATFEGKGVVKHNYAYSAGIHGGGWLGHEKGTLLLGTSACTHPYSACFPAPYDPITKAIGLEATGLMYVIDLSEILPPPEENEEQTTLFV